MGHGSGGCHLPPPLQGRVRGKQTSGNDPAQRRQFFVQAQVCGPKPQSDSTGSWNNPLPSTPQLRFGNAKHSAQRTAQHMFGQPPGQVVDREVHIFSTMGHISSYMLFHYRLPGKVMLSCRVENGEATVPFNRLTSSYDFEVAVATCTRGNTIHLDAFDVVARLWRENPLGAEEVVTADRKAMTEGRARIHMEVPQLRTLLAAHDAPVDANIEPFYHIVVEMVPRDSIVGRFLGMHSPRLIVPAASPGSDGGE